MVKSLNLQLLVFQQEELKWWEKIISPGTMSNIAMIAANSQNCALIRYSNTSTSLSVSEEPITMLNIKVILITVLAVFMQRPRNVCSSPKSNVS